jgi:hypothetical protein
MLRILALAGKLGSFESGSLFFQADGGAAECAAEPAEEEEVEAEWDDVADEWDVVGLGVFAAGAWHEEFLSADAAGAC